MRELPKGWAKVRLEELVVAQKGKKPDHLRNAPADGFLPYLDIQAIEKGEVRKFADAKSSRSSKPEDLLVVWDGARSGWVGMAQAGAVGSTIMALTPCGIEPRYLLHFIASQFQEINTKTRGTGIPHVDPEFFWNLEVPLAPLNEQNRILAKLGKLLGKVDACQLRLAKIPVILKRFRQAVLAAACSGRLTADWREKNGFGDGNELPEGWRLSCVDEVSESLKYGTSKKCIYDKRGVPVLRIPNVVEGTISRTDLKYAELPDKEFQQLRLQPGDILVIRSNGSVSLVGKCALCSEKEKDYAYAGYLIRIRPDRRKVLPEYLNVALGSFDVRLQIEVPARSTSGVNNINSDELRALKFNLPSLLEQQEIVYRLKALFTLADQLEDRYAKAKAHLDRLTQSIFAKAFRGELVSQCPNDETASVLLERIREERAKEVPAKRKPSKGKTIRKKKEAKLFKASVEKAAKPQDDKPMGSIPQTITKYMKPGADYSRAEITDALDLSTYDWNWAIRQLKEEGKVVQTGERRGARYRVSK